jgi:PAS domain S-box-containing protein
MSIGPTILDQPMRSRRVLIVDSDTSFGSSLTPDFAARQFTVEIARTADEAILRMEAGAPDLVLLDLQLPDGAALRLLRVWKAQFPRLEVILMSHIASLTVVVGALSAGARRFVGKPVSVSAVLDELDDRRRPHAPPGPTVAAANHLLSTAGLGAEGADRFFAISSGLLSVAGFDGYFKLLNPAWEKVLGYSIEELCSKPYLELVHPDDRVKANDEALDLCGGQTVFRFRNRYRCKDGSYRWLSWIATPSPAHRLIYASARDVTSVVRMEQGLRESNQRLKHVLASRDLQLRESSVKNETLTELGRFKDEVASMIVHDLKSPLAVIVANYDYLVGGFEGSADCLEALQDSQIAGRRLLRLLTNLVDVARSEAGALEVHPAEMRLSQLLEPIVEQRRVMARTRNIAIVLASSRELTVTADPDLMTRIIENIFDNALRYTPTDGRIEIERREVGPNIEIRIGNTGRAVPVGARSTIFEKHQKGTSEVGHMNSGLGLYFCRLAVEAQGGKMWVEETAWLPTVFGIQLPRTPPVRN